MSVYMYLRSNGTIMINRDPYQDGNISNEVADVIVSLVKRIAELEEEMSSLKYDVRNLEFND